MSDQTKTEVLLTSNDLFFSGLTYLSLQSAHSVPFLIRVFNFFLSQQPDMVQKGGQLAQGTLNMETTPSGGTHMIILQQPSLLLATFQLPEPSSQKTRPTRKKANGTYLPILNSYPRIAPHPSKKPPDKSPSSNKSQTVFKRVCTEHKSDDTPVTISLLEQHFNKQPKLAVSTSRSPCSSSTRGSLSPCSPETISSSLGSPSSSSVNHSTSSPGRGSATTRHRRFLNTVEILRQSGLLDITLRTKELLRQSNATERDIAQLRQHTELLCKAVGDPSCSQSDVAALEHLLRSMAESGSYPNLKVPQNHQSLCHPGSTSQMESISTSESSGPRVVKSSEVSSAQFIAAATGSNICCPAVQQSHQGHGRELEARSKSVEKVTFMPPDSSTG